MNTKDVILCIDDESIILRLIKSQLEGYFKDRFLYEYAQSVEGALKIIDRLKENNQNLVMTIVDQKLPGKQGTEFLTEISKDYPNVIKILFSGKSDIDSIIAAINEAEIYRYLLKPWDEDDFINIVENGLKQYYVKENIELQLAEIHHRVKNNLTIISCLLELQINELKDEQIKSHFKQSINRINSIAKVHELIYKSEDMTSVDIKAYLENIIPAILNSVESQDLKIDFNFDIPSHNLPVNQAIPLGLIFNELITNSVKYAFRQRNNGVISISMHTKKSKLLFTYEDDGNGFDEGIGFRTTKSLGLTLVHLQLQQLESVYNVETENHFKLDFSFNALKPKITVGNVFQIPALYLL